MNAADNRLGAPRRGVWTYENALLLILCATLGCVTFDRLVMNFLSPYVAAEFHLTNAAIGLLASAQSLSNAISGYPMSWLSDASGRRKSALVLAMVAFSLLSGSTGLATSFAMLMAARLMMGLTHGPIVPISHAIMATQSSEHRRGFNMGITQNLGSFALGATIGPVMITRIADAFGWRPALFLTAVPGLVLAVCIWLFVRTSNSAVRTTVRAETGPNPGFLSLFRHRNIVLCVLIGGFFSTWVLVQNTFLPLYLVRVRHMAPTDMGVMMGLTGFAGCVGSVLVPGASDRIGRKPMMLLSAILAIVAPLSVLLVHGSVVLLGVGLFAGWLAAGAIPLFFAVVPVETVSGRQLATAVALIIGVAELAGGVLAPTIAGRAADLYGLSAPLWITAAAAVVCVFLSLFLKETAPRKRLQASFGPDGFVGDEVSIPTD